MMPKILIADDNDALRVGIARVLKRLDLEIVLATNGQEAVDAAKKQTFDLALLDIRMPQKDGLAVLKELRQISPSTRTILMTAHASLDTAIEALRYEVVDYLLKPFSLDELESRIKQILDKYHLTSQKIIIPKKNPEEPHMIGKSAVLQHLKKMAQVIGPTPSPLLILGESGTGKELLAQEMHYLSPYRQHPFVVINCTALSPGLLESELFGHEKGAFTGALSQKEGLFEVADGGTILFDEIGDLPLGPQVKLLRFLQSHEFQRVGGTKTIKVNVRVMAATNRNLKEAVAQKQFREDLFYRLNVFEITIPPLRDRKEDIPLLANHFLEKYQKLLQKETSFSPKALEILDAHSWPGNIRELENVIERAVVLVPNKQPIGPEEFASRILDKDAETPPSVFSQTSVNLKEIEKNVLFQTLEKNRWNQTKTAQELGIKRTTLQYRIQKYEIIKNGH